MFFSSVRTISFRNLSDDEVLTGARDIFLVGENGQGKTNFLEALYFCAYASSFRTVRDSELARTVSAAEKIFSTKAELSQSVNDSILVKFENNKKSIYINGKRADERKELLSIAPTIVFCHEDMEFVSGTPERRRWFFDQTLSLYDPVYLDDLRNYKKVLKTRNMVLRSHSQLKNKKDSNPEAVLDALDPQFIMYGLKLIEKREKAVQEFSELFTTLYNDVSGISGITVNYKKSWKNDDIGSFLQEKRTAELLSGLSLSGPHRDRFIFTKNGEDFSLKASTGQKRLLALLMRASQSRCFSAKTGLNPILLLDDVLLEMDGEKRRRFLSVLPAYDQAFYTFLPDEPYQRYKKDDTLIFNVKNGCLFK